MKTLSKWILASLLLIPFTRAFANTPPALQPIDQVFARFVASYPTTCEQMARDVRSRLSPDAQKDSQDALAALDRYVQNIRGDDVNGIQRVLDGKSSDSLPGWCARLVEDVVGFRRTLDVLLVENLAKSRLQMDDELLKRLQTFWAEERHFSWRFGVEVKRALTRE